MITMTNLLLTKKVDDVVQGNAYKSESDSVLRSAGYGGPGVGGVGVQSLQ